MNIETQLNGSLLLSTRDNNGDLIKHVYYGYSKKEAKSLFLKHLADLLVKEIKAGKWGRVLNPCGSCIPYID